MALIVANSGVVRNAMMNRFIACVIGIAAWSPIVSANDLTIQVHAGKHDRVESPVRIPLPASAKAAHYRIGHGCAKS